MAQSSERGDEHRYRAIFDHAGVSLWVEDLTDLVEALDALRARGIADVTAWLTAHPDELALLRGHVRMLDVNAATLALFGARDKAQLLDGADRIFGPLWAPVFRDKVAALAQGRGHFEGEAVVGTLAGGQRHVLVSVQLMPPQEGRTLAVVSLHDIERRVRVEARLREKSQVYQAILRNVALCVTRVNPDGIVTSSRGLGLRRLGYGDHGLVGRHVHEVWPHVEDALERARAGEVAEQDEWGGTAERSWYFHSFLFPDASVASGVIIISIDLTDLASLKATNAALERSNRDLEQFAYVASHDLRTPLRGIHNLAEWIEEELGDRAGDVVVEYLALLRGRVLDLDALLSGLLQYARVGQVPEDAVDIELDELLGRVVGLLSPRPGFTVTWDRQPWRLHVPRGPLEHVLLNLLDNAIKHHDGASGAIHIGVEPEDDRVRITVTDDGPGVPPEYRERIFGLFQRLKPRRDGSGSGMGLALVRRMVESFGGAIEARAGHEGLGMAFSFTWPMEWPPS